MCHGSSSPLVRKLSPLLSLVTYVQWIVSLQVKSNIKMETVVSVIKLKVVPNKPLIADIGFCVSDASVYSIYYCQNQKNQ